MYKRERGPGPSVTGVPFFLFLENSKMSQRRHVYFVSFAFTLQQMINVHTQMRHFLIIVSLNHIMNVQKQVSNCLRVPKSTICVLVRVADVVHQ